MKLENAHYFISKLSIKLMYLRQCGVDRRADKFSNEREQRGRRRPAPMVSWQRGHVN